MLAERHLGHGVGEEDELLGRVATGDDDVHVGRSLPEHVEHLAERNEVVVKRVRQLVEDDQIDASQIEVTVKNGEVTLSGTVDDRRAKREAEDCASSVSGIHDVQNQIRVKTDKQPAKTTAAKPRARKAS